MRHCFFKIIVILVTIAGLSLPSSAGGKFRTKIKYYTVSGSSASSLERNATVPTGFFSAERVYANIQMKPNFKGTVQQGKRCLVKGFGINVNFLVRLPKLARGTRLSPSLRRKFSGFVAFVKRHEFRHRSIYTSCIRKMENRVARIRVKSCDVFARKAIAIINKEATVCNKRHARFDQSERSRLARHPLIRAAFKKPRRKKTTRRQARRKGAVRARTNFN